ncbi:hypothetical protein PR048_028760 [Dryococelus australis]|uniref:Uncharacterized protein n=1 Tax=Dryococelus australis TaxID=614101 RepID=A0ABQ9GBG0_9NEOP|nr:hypothetical protein PR048_028760 [Dryococelus australis]
MERDRGRFSEHLEIFPLHRSIGWHAREYMLPIQSWFLILQGFVYYGFNGLSRRARYNVTYIDVGAYGRSSDGGRLSVPYVTVADEAFSLKPNVIRPYGKNSITSDAEKKVYDYRHARPRRVNLLRRKQTQQIPSFLLRVCLHNFLRRNDRTVSPFEERVRVNSGEINGLDRMNAVRGNYVREAVIVREKFKNSFISPQGTVTCPWQRTSIRRGFDFFLTRQNACCVTIASQRAVSRDVSIRVHIPTERTGVEIPGTRQPTWADVFPRQCSVHPPLVSPVSLPRFLTMNMQVHRTLNTRDVSTFLQETPRLPSRNY